MSSACLLVVRDPSLFIGIWANNPTMLAVAKAKLHLGLDPSDVRVLSVGAGSWAPDEAQFNDADREFVSFVNAKAAAEGTSYLEALARYNGRDSRRRKLRRRGQ